MPSVAAGCAHSGAEPVGAEHQGKRGCKGDRRHAAASGRTGPAAAAAGRAAGRAAGAAVAAPAPHLSTTAGPLQLRLLKTAGSVDWRGGSNSGGSVSGCVGQLCRIT